MKVAYVILTNVDVCGSSRKLLQVQTVVTFANFIWDTYNQLLRKKK